MQNPSTERQEVASRSPRWYKPFAGAFAALVALSTLVEWAFFGMAPGGWEIPLILAAAMQVVNAWRPTWRREFEVWERRRLGTVDGDRK